MKTYEGMFLLDAGQPNFEEAAAPVRSILQRNQADVLHLKKWDERRLAYEVQGRRRGLYVLVYFKADPEKIGEIEHDVQLNEKILRVMILAADDVTPEKMAAPTPAESEPSRREEEESYFDRDIDRDDRRRPRRGEERGEREPRFRRESRPAAPEVEPEGEVGSPIEDEDEE